MKDTSSCGSLETNNHESKDKYHLENGDGKANYYLLCPRQCFNMKQKSLPTLITLGSGTLAGAALVYIGSCTLAGTDLAVVMSLGLRTDIVLASALAGSELDLMEDFGGTSEGSCKWVGFFMQVWV